jgi:hypothetical protein
VRRSLVRELAEHLDVPFVAMQHANTCPHAGRIYASQCTCETVLAEIPRAEIDSYFAEEERLARLAAN